MIKRKNNEYQFPTLPHMGQRIIKTGAAVFLCLVIYWLRGFSGLVLQSTVAAIICIQPYRADTVNTSVNRIIGTLVGAGWAALFLILVYELTQTSLGVHILFAYGLMSIGVILSIYSCVILKKTDAASLAAVVFICIVGTYPDLSHPFTYMINRIIDTIIGILVADFVNSVSLPREKHEEYLFFLKLEDLVPDRYTHINSNVMVILNRLYDEGAKICLISKWAPAFMLSQMSTMKVNVPVIVMDGAALYDISNRDYLYIKAIEYNDAVFLTKLMDKMGLVYGVYTVMDSSLLIYRSQKSNQAEEENYQLMKRSPYRNYIEGSFNREDQICFIRLIDYDEIIEELEKRIHDLIGDTRFRVVRRYQPRMPGFSGLYFYHPEATVEHCMEMTTEFMNRDQEQQLIPRDMSQGTPYESEHQAIALLHKVRRAFEPVRFPWNKKLQEHL